MGSKYYLFPNSDVSVQCGINPSGVSHYTNVDDGTQESPSTNDASTTYISSGAANLCDIFGLTNVSSDVSDTINSVKLYTCLQAGLAGTTYVNGLYINSTKYSGASGTPPTKWGWVSYTWNTNPNGSVAWTKTAVNDLQVYITLSGSDKSAAYCTAIYVEVDYTASTPETPLGPIFTMAHILKMKRSR